MIITVLCDFDQNVISGGRIHAFSLINALDGNGRIIRVCSKDYPSKLESLFPNMVSKNIDWRLSRRRYQLMSLIYPGVIFLVPHYSTFKNLPDTLILFFGLLFRRIFFPKRVTYFLDFESPCWSKNFLQLPTYKYLNTLIKGRMADIVVSSTEIGRRKAKECYGVYKRQKYFVIPPPILVNRPSVVEKKSEAIIFYRPDLIHKRSDTLDLICRACAKLGLKLSIVIPNENAIKVLPDISCYNTQIFVRPSNEELKSIYSSSKYLFYPSIFEGYGLPPRESLLSKCIPVVQDLEVYNDIREYVIRCDFNNLQDIIRQIMYNNPQEMPDNVVSNFSTYKEKVDEILSYS